MKPSNSNRASEAIKEVIREPYNFLSSLFLYLYFQTIVRMVLQTVFGV